MTARKPAAKAAGRSTQKAKGRPKNSLVANINRRKKAGTSRTKNDSTVSPESYDQMKQGWPKPKKRKAKST